MKMKALCCEYLNNKNKLHQINFTGSRGERACLICLINIHEVFYEVIVSLQLFKFLNRLIILSLTFQIYK